MSFRFLLDSQGNISVEIQHLRQAHLEVCVNEDMGKKHTGQPYSNLSHFHSKKKVLLELKNASAFAIFSGEVFYKQYGFHCQPKNPTMCFLFSNRKRQQLVFLGLPSDLLVTSDYRVEMYFAALISGILIHSCVCTVWCIHPSLKLVEIVAHWKLSRN